MSWICRICATSNPDDTDVCFVCDAEKPSEGRTGSASVCTLTAKRAESLPPLVGGELTVPSEYNEIGEEAFKGRTDIITLRLHAGVRKIRKSAFEGCSNLQTVTSYGTLKHIGTRAFANCPSLTARPTAKYVAEDAFYGESRLDRTARLDSSRVSSSSSETLSGSISFSSGGSSASTGSASSTSSESETLLRTESSSESETLLRTETSSGRSSLSLDESTARVPVSVKSFFATLGLMLGCLLVTALAIVTYYLVFGREWGWNKLQYLVGGVGGAVLFFLLFGWILSMPRCGFAKTGNLFGLFVTGFAAIGNIAALCCFQKQYEILFVWAAAYAVAITVLLAFMRKGKGWKIAYFVAGGIILLSLLLGLIL